MKIFTMWKYGFYTIDWFDKKNKNEAGTNVKTIFENKRVRVCYNLFAHGARSLGFGIGKRGKIPTLFFGRGELMFVPKRGSKS